jgi:hypothetical protein
MIGFHDGFVVEMLQDHGRLVDVKKLISRKLDGDEHYSPVARYTIKREEFEQLCDEVFKIGDQVRSKLGGNPRCAMTATVTGFELDTNSIYLRSSKLEKYRDTRIRYAYKVSEVEHYNPDKVEFAIGQRYLLNGKTRVTCVEHPDYEDKVLLYDTNGRLFCSPPKNTFLSNLKLNLYGHIDSIKDI